MHDFKEARIKTIAMPKDTNASGNIFGGWIMSQIDLAGAVAAHDLNIGRIVTVAVHSMEFKKAIQIGDVVSCYGKIIHVGKTSIRVQVEVYAKRLFETTHEHLHAASATLTYVQVNAKGEKMPILYTQDELLALGIK